MAEIVRKIELKDNAALRESAEREALAAKVRTKRKHLNSFQRGKLKEEMARSNQYTHEQAEGVWVDIPPVEENGRTFKLKDLIARKVMGLEAARFKQVRLNHMMGKLLRLFPGGKVA